jgi:hypothetical protein
MSATGELDPADGIREFIVGTGGSYLRDFITILPTSEFRWKETHGLLVLYLRESDYSWEYRTTPDGAVIDSGQGFCH